MNLKRPKFWQKKTFISFLIFPLTFITYLINKLKNLEPKKNFKIKTICVGNIFLGGTGKTSLIISINEILKKKFKTVFIKKNYTNQKDEINLLKKSGKVISSNNRILSLNLAEKKKFQFALLDDGLQQKNINYNLKIVCFNSQLFIGNNFLIPAGPLRESINELKNYDIVFINGESKKKGIFKKIRSLNKNIKIFEGNYFPKNLDKLDIKKDYLMFCGIGNPHEFKNTLLKYNFKLKRKIYFSDHHIFSNNEINNIKKIADKDNLTIITTEKDYLRLSMKQRKKIKYLKISLEVKNLNKFKQILFKV